MTKTTSTLENPSLAEKVGLVKSAFAFKDSAVKAKTSHKKFSSSSSTFLTAAQPDDERYGRGGYNTASVIPTGPEFTVRVTERGTKTNGLIQGCQGGCEKEPWYFGFDQGFAALAGVKVKKHRAGCSMVLRPSDHPNPGDMKKVQEEILRVCNGRCANFLYGTTVDLSKRTDTPGYRTMVGLLCNWSSWVSCSMYDALSEWIAGKGEGFAWADTLKTSKIHFVEANLHVVGRPHEDRLLDKGHGWDDEGSPEWVETCRKYGLRGTYMRQNIGILALIYEIGMYDKGPLSWSCMALDTKFFVDYNLAADNSPCNSWWDHVDRYSREAIHKVVDNTDCVPSSSDDDDKSYVASYAVGCAYTYGALQVKQRREQDIGKAVTMRRGGVVFEDRELWTSLLLVDAGLSQMALMAGGCADDYANCAFTRVINDVVDLGYDWCSGEVCNSILTITQGKTDRDSLRRAYVKVAAVLNRMSMMRPDTVGSVGCLSVQAWQMCNSRHRVIPCTLVSNDPGIGPTELSATYYEAFIQDLDPVNQIDLKMETGVLLGKRAMLTARSWDMVAKDRTGMVAKLLYHGHIWLVDLRRARKVATAQEITATEDIIRILMVTMAMEFERTVFVEVLWCWMIESWCGSDMMWHAMIGSTTLSSDQQIGSDRLDDKQWVQTSKDRKRKSSSQRQSSRQQKVRK
ncbi:hypothetical protein BGZ83_005229 [Gryganskiella cystojenkinii]|nr:hypothetical protein BGZ83_005229 [Gryganskiella cystojenkinii]